MLQAAPVRIGESTMMKCSDKLQLRHAGRDAAKRQGARHAKNLLDQHVPLLLKRADGAARRS
eukprot:622140-Pleurochrysis_carterae.AAC.3